MTIKALMGNIRDKYVADAANLTTVLMSGDLDTEVRDTPWDKGQIHLGITVWWPNKVGESRGANKLDDFLYPIMATMVQGKSGSADAVNDAVDEFFSRSKALFHNQRIAADSTVLRTIVKFGQVVLPAQWRDEYIASQLAIVVTRREIRT